MSSICGTISYKPVMRVARGSAVASPQDWEGWAAHHGAWKAEGREQARVTVRLEFACDSLELLWL